MTTTSTVSANTTTSASPATVTAPTVTNTTTTTSSNDILDEETCDYYYGAISRETAEYILWDKGCSDSMFLIRKSNSDYVLSLCYQKSILHYRVSYLGNGEVMLHGYEAQKFPSIGSLLQNVEGLAVKPMLPCERSTGWQLPPTYWGLTVAEIRSAIIAKSHQWGFTEALVTFPIEYLSLGNDDYNRCILTEVTKSLINKTLHEIQPWYHGRLTRLEGEKSLEESGHKEGKFLVRERDESSYALCVSHEGTAKHYRIDILASGELAIQDGHKFPSMMSLVSHYTVFTDGLWTSLGEPCPRLILSGSQSQSQQQQHSLYSGSNQIVNELILSSVNINEDNSTSRQNNYNTNNNNLMNGLLTCRRNYDSQQHQLSPQQQQQQQYYLQHQRRSISSDRSRNLINTHSLRGPHSRAHLNSSPSTSSSTVKLKDWLSTINQKWSQLISAVSPRNDSTCSTNLRSVRRTMNTSSLHHHHPSNSRSNRLRLFSTLPRSHLIHSNNQSIPVHLQPHHHISNHRLPNQQYQYQTHQQQYNLHHQQQQHFNNQYNQQQRQQSIYDYASSNGHQNSLNFRSLNVEINSPWINTNPHHHHFLLQRNHNLLLHSHGTNEIVTESNHYQETDLFPNRNNNNSNINNNHHNHHQSLSYGVNNNGKQIDTDLNDCLTCSHLNSNGTLISPETQSDFNSSLLTSFSKTNGLLEGKNGQPKQGLKANGSTGPYLVKGLIKSTSLESIYSVDQQHHPIIPSEDLTDLDPESIVTCNCDCTAPSGLIPPLPVPRKSKPDLRVRAIVQYANQEIIGLHRSRDNSIEYDEDDDESSERLDLLIFDDQQDDGREERISNKGPNPTDSEMVNLHENCNQQIRTLIELITEGYFNQTFRLSTCSSPAQVTSDGPRVDRTPMNNNNTSSCPPNDNFCLHDNTLYSSSGCAISSNANNSISNVNNVDQTNRPNDECKVKPSSEPVIESKCAYDVEDATKIHDVQSSSDSQMSCSNVCGGSREQNFEDSKNQNLSCHDNRQGKEVEVKNENPNYEEINEELMKEIERTRPSIELLREFDSCFVTLTDQVKSPSSLYDRRLSEPSRGHLNEVHNEHCSTKTSSSSQSTDKVPEMKQKATRSGSESKTTNKASSSSIHWTAIDASGVQMYDYDALKFDRDFIVKEASLGLTSLEPSQSGSQVKLNELDLICLEEDPEEVNKSVVRYRQGPISLDPKFINLQKPLGNGYFGEVYLGTIPSSTGCASIQVAVKVLKLKAIPNHKSEILREAQTMSALDHKHIVRLIGVCETDPIMIVMELAPLGPLNQYLLDHGFTVTIKDIIALLLQVALAMQYLESKQFIHRDLAARNVLLVNEKFAKISDFGMSRALGIGKEYYKAKSASKWPLKWYAPECIYYFKFSTKSDVWSYGVTMWESLSYGQKPYEGMDGQDILRLFRENGRLHKPDNCPDEIYQLMWKCWQFRPEDRPTFAEICQTMTTYFLCSNL